MADVWGNWMACHTRDTCHIAGCCHLDNSMSRFQSYVSRCRVLPLGEFTVTIPDPHATLQDAVTWQNQCHDRGALQGVRIRSAILKIVFTICYFLFLVQFRLWWAAAVVSSPIHTLTMKNTTLLLFSYKSSIQLDIGNKQVFSFTVSTTNLHRNLCRLNTATYHKMLNAL